MSVVLIPWVFLSLGDRVPNGTRPIYYKARNATKARVVGYAYPAGVARLSEACEAYNAQKNAKTAAPDD